MAVPIVHLCTDKKEPWDISRLSLEGHMNWLLWFCGCVLVCVCPTANTVRYGSFVKRAASKHYIPLSKTQTSCSQTTQTHTIGALRSVSGYPCGKLPRCWWPKIKTTKGSEVWYTNAYYLSKVSPVQVTAFWEQLHTGWLFSCMFRR